jgi:hypothetical protein
VRAGQVAMEASNAGQYSVVRFTAPVAGRYRVTARFEGIHFGLSTTDVHVVHGSTVLFSANVDGYGGDPAFQPVTGQRGCDVGADDCDPASGGAGCDGICYNPCEGILCRAGSHCVAEGGPPPIPGCVRH